MARVENSATPSTFHPAFLAKASKASAPALPDASRTSAVITTDLTLGLSLANDAKPSPM